MGVFHVFKIVQMVSNWAKCLKYSNIKCQVSEI